MSVFLFPSSLAAGVRKYSATDAYAASKLAGVTLAKEAIVRGATPVVLADRCVGCGLCQTRCYGINVVEKNLLTKSAIIIEAGPGKEDR